MAGKKKGKFTIEAKGMPPEMTRKVKKKLLEAIKADINKADVAGQSSMPGD